MAKIAIVTGASRNIGRAIALALARDGMEIVCFGRDQQALRETAATITDLGGRASVFVGDAASNQSMADVVAHAGRDHGGVDVVVNNAGMLRDVKSQDITPEQFAADLQVNLVAQFALARAAYPVLKARGGGVIVNIGSIAGARAFPRCVSYVTSKTAIDGLTRALAYDWARDNIRVLCVAPGYVESNISKDAMANDTTREWILKKIPMRRIGKPEEVGDLVAFLASDRARYATGETYYLDGGERTAI